jgi:FixJ family two-component response regulator
MAIRRHIVAVVDDDHKLRKALARLLSTYGCRVQLFSSAADFLSAADTSEATCLLVDIHLGNSSGLDLARRLAAAGHEFPIIFISGSDEDTIRQQCVELGCVAYLQKPPPQDRLIHAIQKAIGSKLQLG